MKKSADANLVNQDIDLLPEAPSSITEDRSADEAFSKGGESYGDKNSNINRSSDGTAVSRMATPDRVERKRANHQLIPRIKREHLVRILVDDKQVAELSEDQLDRIKLMHETIERGASFSFNYNTLLITASILAGLGLVSNASATVIASMLVSPIMGPVIGLAYGTTINDWQLVWRSIKVELISILICMVIGAGTAILTGFTQLSDNWPTEEMTSRGTLENLLVALPVAFFSGLGVAVSVLDDQTSSLVGVAISASLLPPAVNAGILYVAFGYYESGIISYEPTPYPEEPIPEETSKSQHPGIGEDYTRSEYFEMGTHSLLVTIANIALIWLSGMLMFRMKEVLPIEKNVFWTDLGLARKTYQRRALIVDKSQVNHVGPPERIREEE